MDILLEAVNWFFNFLYITLFVYCIMSWIPPLRTSGLGKIIESFISPMLTPLRKLVAKSPLGGPGMMIDISVIILFALMSVARTLVLSVLIMLLG